MATNFSSDNEDDSEMTTTNIATSETDDDFEATEIETEDDGSSDSRRKLSSTKRQREESGKLTTPIGDSNNGVEPKKPKKNNILYWNWIDECTVLKQFWKFAGKNGTYSKDFHSFVKNKLTVEVSNSQLSDKVYRLKKRFLKDESNMKETKKKFKDSKYKKLFKLSKKNWGSKQNQQKSEDKGKEKPKDKDEDEYEDKDEDNNNAKDLDKDKYKNTDKCKDSDEVKSTCESKGKEKAKGKEKVTISISPLLKLCPGFNRIADDEFYEHLFKRLLHENELDFDDDTVSPIQAHVLADIAKEWECMKIAQNEYDQKHAELLAELSDIRSTQQSFHGRF